MSFNMNDYIDVKTRIALFYAKYPEGSLQFYFKGSLEHDPEMIWGIAYAYRSADDRLPAIGHAQELAKGKTNFTRGSELQNLETSAIGRCIGMLNIGIDKSLATSDEIEAAQERQRPNPVNKGGHQSTITSAGASEKQLETITKLMPSPQYVADWKAERNITGKINKAEASDLIADLINLKAQNKDG
jgi:hypothetical protein